MSIYKRILFRIIPNSIRAILAQKEISKLKNSLKHSSMSYSQEGEDLLINRFLATKEKGFYVDVGAHHPKRFSNTYNFYKKGWRGINIDAMPGSMDAFNSERPNDINLEVGVSKERGELLYHMFNESALNTFSKAEAKKKNGLRGYKIIEEREVFTYPLKEILRKYLLENDKIDFMTIDVEGLDLEVLESNNWEKYRPTLILTEDLKKIPLADLPLKSDLFKFLLSNDYELVAKTFNTLFFIDSRL